MGTNLGERRRNLAEAVRLIGERVGAITGRSGIHETEPWGEVAGENGGEAGDFLNMAVAVETALEPGVLLAEVKSIESSVGRRSGRPPAEGGTARRYESRIIDIDIIYYGDRVVDLPELKVPHPLVGEREFVLRPLAELVPDSLHPVTGLTPAEMLRRLEKKI